MAIVEVRNLKISFWTNNGTVKAVRNISFNVEEGQTLAIVGESGSGKSVTAKAMLGILAGNAIIEGGEIYYDGKDLLKVPEEVFHQIRGNNIAMIFQDPLSSLNPIMKVGKQLTEAMIANNYAQRRQSKINYKVMISALNDYLAKSGMSSGEVSTMMGQFQKFIVEGNKLETEYNIAHDTLETTVSNIDGTKIDIIDKPVKDVAANVKQILNYSKKSVNRFLIPSGDSKFAASIQQIEQALANYKGGSEDKNNKSALEKALDGLKAIILDALKRPTPDFLAVGYYSVKNGRAALDGKEINRLNEEAKTLLNVEFIDNFSLKVGRAIDFADREAKSNREAVFAYFKSVESELKGNFDPKTAKEIAAKSKPLVEKSINKLDTVKDSVAYTYTNAIDNAVKIFTLAAKSDGYKEAKKAKVRKKDRLPEELDLTILRENIRLIIRRLTENFEQRNRQDVAVDYKQKAVDLIYYLDREASRKDYVISQALAKSRAIDLMNEVGIPHPRLRYNQYPFEFSGGMRQRIVIAIALASNPDVLICDEPTTALDVTIQAQILDLINDLKKKRKLSIIFITHDLGVVANMADNIAVMYAGKIVEMGSSDEVFYQSAHPYTWALLSSMPDLDTKEKLEYIPGVPPNMIYPPKGDAFARRNKYALEIDFEEEPPMFEITPTHFAATWLLHPDAPKVEPPAIITDRIRRMHEKWGGIL